jgi:hypothetical protein
MRLRRRRPFAVVLLCAAMFMLKMIVGAKNDRGSSRSPPVRRAGVKQYGNTSTKENLDGPSLLAWVMGKGRFDKLPRKIWH